MVYTPVMRFQPYREPRRFAVLQVDAMFFRAAEAALVDARKQVPRIASAERSVDRHLEALRNVRKRDDDDDDDDDGVPEITEAQYARIERLSIQLNDLEYQLASQRGRMLQSIGPVHILSSACLEAHINARAQDVLLAAHYRAFERLALDGKWLLFPKLASGGEFDPGAEPFQTFAKMLRWRNALVHYKQRREQTYGWYEPPRFLDDLGLTLENAERAFATTADMIVHLAKKLGGDVPQWVAGSTTNFFEIQIERES